MDGIFHLLLKAGTLVKGPNLLILNDFLTLAFSQLPTTMLTTVPSPMELLMFIEADLNSLLWIFSRIWLVNNRDLCNLC